MAQRFLTNEDKDELIKMIDDAPTDSKYFDIDYDGIVSLKPEYRGRAIKADYPYAVSDNGINADGSKNGELPEKIVIPDVIKGTAVAGFQIGMFYYNYRVKEIVLPDTVKELPAQFCRWAKNLKAVHNTEGITKLAGSTIFAYTSVEELNFPNLTSVVNGALGASGHLKVVDIGNNLTEIPYQFLNQCPLLTVVNGGGKVKTIGGQAFGRTHRLRTLSFLPQVTSIGADAFYRSGIEFDWDSIKATCTFGARATPVMDNTVDYWSGVDHTKYACENPILTIMSQKDPTWTNLLTLGCNSLYYGAHGCALFTAIHIHSALAGKGYSHPNEFVRDLVATGYPTLEGYEKGVNDTTHPRNSTELVQNMYECLGHSAEICVTQFDDEKEYMDKAMYEKVCAALKAGAYIYAVVGTVGNEGFGHAVCIYGVTEKGEMLVADPDYLSGLSLGEVGVNREKFLYRMPLRNLSNHFSDIVIVKKQ